MKKIDVRNIRRIMVRATNWVGDAVMITPALGAIRETFPDAEIVVVAKPIVAPLFDPHPYCDRVLVFDKQGKDRGISGLIRFGAALRRERFDLAILLQKAIEAAILATLAGIPRRLGYRTDGRRLLLTHSLPFTPGVRRQHHVKHYLHLLSSFGIQGSDDKLRLLVTPEEADWAKNLMGEGNWLAINPGAAYGSAKRWIPERFAEVGDRLAREYDLRVVLTGGPGEREIGRDIEQAMQCSPLNLIGETSVRQMAAVLSRCRLVVTNDSGPMHVAAAFGVPIVAVFGPTDHTTTHPYSEAFRVVRKEFECAPCLKRQCPTDHQCMNAVTVEDVVSAAKNYLEENANAG
jgi:heptosyltransferase-2